MVLDRRCVPLKPRSIECCACICRAGSKAGGSKASSGRPAIASAWASCRLSVGRRGPAGSLGWNVSFARTSAFCLISVSSKAPRSKANFDGPMRALGGVPGVPGWRKGVGDESRTSIRRPGRGRLESRVERNDAISPRRSRGCQIITFLSAASRRARPSASHVPNAKHPKLTAPRSHTHPPKTGIKASKASIRPSIVLPHARSTRPSVKRRAGGGAGAAHEVCTHDRRVCLCVCGVVWISIAAQGPVCGRAASEAGRTVRIWALLLAPVCRTQSKNPLAS